MKKKKLVIIISICVLVLIATAVYVATTKMQKELQTLSTAQIREFEIDQVPNGVYTGQYTTVPVAAKVEITIRDGRITDIKLLEHQNGQGKPAEAILDQVLDSQTLGVDVIAGATYSSKVILKAIEDALAKASSN